MQLLGFTVVGMMLFIVGFSLNLGGAVSTLIFLAILFVGALLHAWKPLVDWARGPAAKLNEPS